MPEGPAFFQAPRHVTTISWGGTTFLRKSRNWTFSTVSLAYLQCRGLTDETIRAAGLGYHAGARWECPELWGLPAGGGRGGRARREWGHACEFPAARPPLIFAYLALSRFVANRRYNSAHCATGACFLELIQINYMYQLMWLRGMLHITIKGQGKNAIRHAQ